MRAWFALVVCCACGRVNFDPLGGGDDQAGDGSTPSGSGETCAEPRAIGAGMLLPDESLAGAGNDITNGPCVDGIEVVYRLDVTESREYAVTILATFDGGLWMSMQCPSAGGACVPYTANMSRLLNPIVDAGSTWYIIVDKTAGAGTTFSLAVQ
ncbi:MAG TPA: hypothetical protein VIV11_30070 [Kofleriaceae bacterium]